MASSSRAVPASGGRSILDNMVGVGDMVLLEPMTEDAVMENLWERYNSKDIYVSNTQEERIYRSWNVMDNTPGISDFSCFMAGGIGKRSLFQDM